MLFSPLFMPAVALLVIAKVGYEEAMASVGLFVHFLIVTSLIGGTPYLIFSIALTLWCRKKSAREIKKLSWWLPWAFTPLCGLFMYIAFLRTYPDGDAGEATLLMVVFCVPVCFFYVFMVHLLTRLGLRLEFIKPENANP